MKRILFVDDEPNVLAALRRGLRSERAEWELHFAASAEEALLILADQSLDVIVTDMRMPGMDGAELLTRVSQDHPGLVRIALSGQSDEEILLKSAAPTHQFLTKPCAAHEVLQTISRACALRDLLSGDELKSLVGRIGSLPILPEIYTRLQEAVRDPSRSVEDVGAIVSSDIGLSTKILQIVNSAFFGLRQKVSSPAQATCLLGLDIVKALVLTAAIFDGAEVDECSGIDLDELWRQSNACAALARRIARLETDDRHCADEAYLAGLLHEVGRLVLASSLPERVQRAVEACGQERWRLDECERAEFGSGHAEVGAYLLGLWGMADPIVEAIAFHERPDDCQSEGFDVLTAVHAAHLLLQEPEAPPLEERSAEHLDRIGCQGRVGVWRNERDSMNQAKND